LPSFFLSFFLSFCLSFFLSFFLSFLLPLLFPSCPSSVPWWVTVGEQTERQHRRHARGSRWELHTMESSAFNCLHTIKRVLNCAFLKSFDLVFISSLPFSAQGRYDEGRKRRRTNLHRWKRRSLLALFVKQCLPGRPCLLSPSYPSICL